VLLAFGIVYFVWGSTFLAIRVGVREVPPFLLAAMRFLLAGIALLLRAIWFWKQVHFTAQLSPEENLRRLIPAVTLIVLGVQGIFSSFFMSALGLKTAKRKPPTA